MNIIGRGRDWVMKRMSQVHEVEVTVHCGHS
jgi:hypothetical protein